MAFFGRKPKKPGSVPGAASGGAEDDVRARLVGLSREVARGRQQRPQRMLKVVRATRGERRGR